MGESTDGYKDNEPQRKLLYFVATLGIRTIIAAAIERQLSKNNLLNL